MLDLYRFLATLHYDIKDLKISPPGGWPQITPESCIHFKSDYAIKVLQHLPYYNSSEFFHVNAHLLDWSTLPTSDFHFFHQDTDENEWESIESEVPSGWILPIAVYVRPDGSAFFMNVVDGEMIEELRGYGPQSPCPIDMWIDEVKEAYTKLHFIPHPNRVTIECAKVDDLPDGADRITEEQIIANTEDWPSKLDIHYLRQVYRDYGWPKNFQREAAFAKVANLLETLRTHGIHRYWCAK